MGTYIRIRVFLTRRELFIPTGPGKPHRLFACKLSTGLLTISVARMSRVSAHWRIDFVTPDDWIHCREIVLSTWFGVALDPTISHTYILGRQGFCGISLGNVCCITY